MTPRPPLNPGPHLVLGLARSGRAAALALAARGETVLGVDAGDPDVSALTAAGVTVRTGDDGIGLLEGCRSVIKSPGVPWTAPVLAQARRNGVPVIGELELAWRLMPNEFIAVTGTNGKTTTTELVAHIHRVAGLPVAAAGNVGTALSALVGTLSTRVTVVCEASSFQLEDTDGFAPEAAVLLNLSPDHLDRHGTLEAYRAAKLRMFAHQGNDDIAVAPSALRIDDLGGCARRVCFGERPDDELSLRAETLWWDRERVASVDELSLRGAHNVANAMAAAAVTLARGVEVAAVAEALRSFGGVAHRLEEIGRRAGALYVNDSKATNVNSTLCALASFPDQRVHLILGGEGKGQEFSVLGTAVAARARAVYLIGRDAALIEQALAGSGVEVLDCGDLERAVAEAARRAAAGEVVLLSPACASYDQYLDFEARGEHFRELVGALGGVEPVGRG